MTKRPQPLRVALLGPGVVGKEAAQLLIDEAAELGARVGRPLELAAVGSRRASVEGIDQALLTSDLDALVRRNDIDLVVELIGGIEPARSLILAAIEHGKSVVTANKALLARHGAELFAAADAHGVDVYYEAAVGGAIPIIRPLRESLVADSVTAVMGIVNGTTNYILDQMHTHGVTYAEALADAQKLGFAEADPTADVEGHDAAAKAAILASLAFHTRVTFDDVACEGISSITAGDIAAAKEMGCVIKLLARCAKADDGSVAVGVHPTMVPLEHPLASVSGAFNAVFVELEWADKLMFMGPGAGGRPTASAVVGDVVTAARNKVRGVAGPGETSYNEPNICDPGRVSSRYYLQMVVQDSPGVLAQIATCFAAHDVSIQAVRQVPAGPDAVHEAQLGIMTHTAPNAQVRALIAALETMAEVDEGVRVLRVEGE
ncbi:MAG TPA: homoserine dehydrogenase [Propioniciclava tarda]|nr:homoserine dehydrogenase [Propioniciclava tarda]